MGERYYLELAAAAVRGTFIRNAGELPLCERLVSAPINELSPSELELVIRIGIERGVRLHHFKKSVRMLPRVHKVLGFLKGISFNSLLDVGSGRGAFLFPFMQAFPYVSVQALDILEKRYELLSDTALGGIERLSVSMADICSKPFADSSFDVVTMLEVLEHIPDVAAAISAAVSIAGKYVVVTVPSAKDDNPEHIHLLTKERLTELFLAAGAQRLSFDSVPGHLFMVAAV